MIAVIVPYLDTPVALQRVLGELAALDPELAVYVVDDASHPALTMEPALRQALASSRVRVLRHDPNRGYGAAQKTGYAAALSDGATRIALLHGDGQYDTTQTLALVDACDADGGADIVLGSRFLANPGTIPAWRRHGNRALTVLANARLGTAFSELHTGARAFRADALRRLALEALDDDFIFDQQVIIRAVRAGLRVVERPVTVRYDETTRSISPSRSLAYAAGCVWEILR